MRDRDASERLDSFTQLNIIYINGAEFGKSHINGKSELVCENRRAIAVLLFGSYQTSRSQVCAEYL